MGLKVVYFGTPDFAVEGLKKIHESTHELVAVVTMPDKPVGRGYQLTASPVKKFALSRDILVLQPEKLGAKAFVAQLKDLEADIFVVVAFRKLPQKVWMIPPKGTFNLHASLLPNYRGAAPINYAIWHNEKETGVTTFFINDKIDEGALLLQKKVIIPPNFTAGDLHDELMTVGGGLIIETLNGIATNHLKATPQSNLAQVKTAYKIFKDDCVLLWDKTAEELHHQVRALSPFPTAFFWAKYKGQVLNIKVFKSYYRNENKTAKTVNSDGKSYLTVAAKSGVLELHEVQLPGKKRITIQQLLQGFDLTAFEVQ